MAERGHGIRTGIYRSKFEAATAAFLIENNVDFMFEEVKIPYTIPERESKYTPDFVLGNGIIIETKGKFVAADRYKQLLIREQEPDYDIRLVFYNANAKLTKTSKNTYSDWADKHGFKWSHKFIPKEWLKEKPGSSYDYMVELGLIKKK